MSDELNPYAPPAAVEPLAKATQPDALAALRAPSLGLLILSGSMCLGIPLALFGLFGHVFVIVLRMRAGLDPIPNLPSWEGALYFAGGVLCITSSVIVLRGALCMRRGKNYRAAVIAAILSCIPFLSPLVYFGIPLGIWALIVLHRPAVRAAFRS